MPSSPTRFSSQVGGGPSGPPPRSRSDPPAQLCVADQPPHLPSRAGGRNGADEIGHRRRERARLAAGRERRIAVGRWAVMNPTGHILAERTWLGARRRAGVIRRCVLLGPAAAEGDSGSGVRHCWRSWGRCGAGRGLRSVLRRRPDWRRIFIRTGRRILARPPRAPRLVAAGWRPASTRSPASPFAKPSSLSRPPPATPSWPPATALADLREALTGSMSAPKA